MVSVGIRKISEIVAEKIKFFADEIDWWNY
jgi:hypothetical protein